jgi:hypothetical protein
MSAASRVIDDDDLRWACAAIYAAVMRAPVKDRIDVLAVAIRALVDTGSLDAHPRSGVAAHQHTEKISEEKR